MTRQEKEEVINSVIEILLPLSGKKQSLDNKLQEIASREAVEVAVRRVGGIPGSLQANYSAIAILVNEVGLKTVADFAVTRCLTIYDAKKSELFDLDSGDALNAATWMLTFASVSVRERVIAAVAENGWYGRIEAMAKQYLNRGLTAKEVMALVDSYVNNWAIRAEHQEADLIRITRTHAPEIMEIVSLKISKFIKNWERGSGY